MRLTAYDENDNIVCTLVSAITPQSREKDIDMLIGEMGSIFVRMDEDDRKRKVDLAAIAGLILFLILVGFLSAFVVGLWKLVLS